MQHKNLKKLNLIEWLAAKFRNAGRATEGGTVHSVVMKVYDNGQLVLDREIDVYESAVGFADDLYIAGHMNAYTSELYGGMRKRMKEAERAARKAAK